MASPSARSNATTILLADDDVALANFLSKSLESEGYSVHTALDEASVLEELRRQNYQLIILDLNFGQTDGLKLLEVLRRQGVETPVIVLSARESVTDRIQSLNLGADDYVTKPFSFQELAARANALLRRKADPALNVLRIEDLELDPISRRVHRGHREIKLSPREFDLLHLLLRRGGETVARHELLKECWGQEAETDSNLVDVYVNYLRRKIDVSDEEKLIYTIRGAGYRLGKAVLNHSLGFADTGESLHSPAGPPQSAQDLAPADAITVPQTPLPALIHSIAHDLAQPLTSVRCYLEILALRGATLAPDDKNLKTIEQQADRAVGLIKGISALVREAALPLPNTQQWVSLDSLLNDVFNDFAALQNSGLMLFDRQTEASVQVTDTPVLRQLCIFIVSKLAGKNTCALTLSVGAKLSGGHCDISFSWKASGTGTQPAVASGKTVMSDALSTMQEMADSMGGEFSVPADNPEIIVRVPAPPPPTAARPGRFH